MLRATDRPGIARGVRAQLYSSDITAELDNRTADYGATRESIGERRTDCDFQRGGHG